MAINVQRNQNFFQNTNAVNPLKNSGYAVLVVYYRNLQKCLYKGLCPKLRINIKSFYKKVYILRVQINNN